MNEKLLHKDLTQEIIGAFYTVYNEFGSFSASFASSA